MKKLSVVIPAYNEEQTVEGTVRTVARIFEGEGIPFELLFVDDGSSDGTWESICRTSCADSRVRGVRLSRNFGKDPAVFAGLSKAQGDCVAVMDCDLQHPPATLVQMYRLWEDGYQVVRGMKRDGEKHSIFYKIFTRGFNSFLGRVTKSDMHGVSDFILLDKSAAHALLSYRERDAFFRVLASSIGFKRIDVPFTVARRSAGTSKWNFVSLLRYAVRGITGFSGVPAYAAFVGCALFFALGSICTVLGAFDMISARAIGCMLLFGFAWLFASMGILGAYVYKLWRQCANRPQYIISEMCGENDEETV